MELAIYTALLNSKTVPLVREESRYDEIIGFLYYAGKVNFFLSQEQEAILSNWVSYVNSKVESYSWYDDVKQAIIRNFGEAFFNIILFEYGHLLQRTERRNELLCAKHGIEFKRNRKYELTKV